MGQSHFCLAASLVAAAIAVSLDFAEQVGFGGWCWEVVFDSVPSEPIVLLAAGQGELIHRFPKLGVVVWGFLLLRDVPIRPESSPIVAVAVVAVLDVGDIVMFVLYLGEYCV